MEHKKCNPTGFHQIYIRSISKRHFLSLRQMRFQRLGASHFVSFGDMRLTEPFERKRTGSEVQCHVTGDGILEYLNSKIIIAFLHNHCWCVNRYQSLTVCVNLGYVFRQQLGHLQITYVRICVKFHSYLS